ncbi:hypothetical protein NX779_00205 [Mycoplasma cottewii]|uniref:Uncharacterized protein n=1 Tax=Mycoplasma cottewii TaxID=51364 RepID=A0ABY5TXH8_9MOLU|nr:hypothetical protein NX779_00205 [Mycoplasma cottewii]
MKNIIEDIKNNRRKYLIRLICLILGFYLFSLSIALYAVTNVGASQVDFTNFAILGIFDKWTNKDSGLVELSQYKIALTALYLFLMILSAIFLSVSILKKYKVEKNKNYE